MTRSFLNRIPSLGASFGRLRWSHAALLLSAVFAAANWQLLTGQAYEKWDAYSLGAPYYSLLADFARAGQLLFWNPWVAGGSPDFAAAGSATFSPDLLLFALIAGPTAQAYVIYWLLVWLAGGLGMLLLARQLHAPAWGGLIVALGYLFSGFYTGHAEHLSVVYSHSLLPLIICRLDAALSRLSFLAAAQAGVLLGLSGLAGYPELTLGSIVVLGAWWMARVFFDKGGHLLRDWKTSLALVVVVFGTALVVLSPTLFAAVYESRGYSDRSSPLQRDFALASNALHPGALTTFSSPSIAALKLAEPSRWSYTDVSSLSLYTGSATLLLVAIALMSRTARRWKLLVLGGGVLALACAMSQTFALRGWLYDLLPPARYFRHASMLRGYLLFALSVIALSAFAEIARQAGNRMFWRRVAILWGGVGAIPLLAFAAVVFSTGSSYPNFPLATAHCLIVWGAPAILAVLLYCKPRHADLLGPVLILVALLDGVGSYGLSGGTIREVGQRPDLAHASNSSVALGTEKFERALGRSSENLNLISKVPTLKNYAPLKNRFYELTATYPQLGFIAVGKDRVWFAETVPQVGLSRRAFEEFKDHVTQLDAPIFVRHTRDTMMSEYSATDLDLARIHDAPTAHAVPISVSLYEPGKLVLDAKVPADGWLMITERWSRSWRARVNGAEHAVSGANFIFRALPVKKGDAHLEFEFKPPGIAGMIFASWSVVALVTLLTLSAPSLDWIAVVAQKRVRRGLQLHLVK